MICKNCGNTVPRNASACPVCGVRTSSAGAKTVFCTKCGKKLSPSAAVCPVCGSKAPPSRMSAIKNVCPVCLNPLAPGDTECRVCGKKVSHHGPPSSVPTPRPDPPKNHPHRTAYIPCRKCGSPLAPNAVFCTKCGASAGMKRTVGKSSLVIDIKEKTVYDRNSFKKKTLLKDVRANIKSGDFTLILGGSGAGKSTFIKAVLGESKARGKILLDGKDLYKNFKTLKSQIGVVPQHSILRDDDSVKNTVMDAAKMKLSGLSDGEIERRVNGVMKKLGLDQIQNNLICNISGGQMKKVAVATQLIGDQKVFVFDEPDSGLDVASRKQQMGILKDIADSDKTVLVITHAPDDAAELFTKVIVLAKSSKDGAGHVAYFGDVRGALKFFGTGKLQDIIIELNPKAEGGKGRSDEFIEKYRILSGEK